MSYRYRATEPFWTHFYRLSPSQKEAARRTWQVFKVDPFDPRLRPHEIHRLSALHGRTIHAVDIEGDLRCVFYVEDDWVVSVGRPEKLRNGRPYDGLSRNEGRLSRTVLRGGRAGNSPPPLGNPGKTGLF